jgi:lipopolysaccharide-induced tumor necrosis factor-alpha factor
MAQPMMAQPVMAHPQVQQVVAVNPPLGGQHMGRVPRTGVCPHCRATVTTGLQLVTSNGTHVACLGLCLVGCSLGCCFAPYCVDDCKEVRHMCPACNRCIGTQVFLM